MQETFQKTPVLLPVNHIADSIRDYHTVSMQLIKSGIFGKYPSESKVPAQGISQGVSDICIIRV